MSERQNRWEWFCCVAAVTCGIVAAAIFYGAIGAAIVKYAVSASQQVTDIAFFAISLTCAAAMILLWRKLAKAFGFGHLVETKEQPNA